MQNFFTKNKWCVLLLFGLIGQIAWTVENMYFNLFVFDEIQPNLDAITLMVQLSGIAATLVTLIAGTVSDKLGNRRSFISIGYIIWGVTVALFGFITPDIFSSLFGISEAEAIKAALVTAIVGDCVMTLFGSTANDAAFSSWVTDNTDSSIRGRIESVVAILPLASMLIVAGAFGIIVEAVGYSTVFLALGIVISICGIVGLFIIKDSDTLTKNGTLLDMLTGFKPSSVRKNPAFYMTLIITCVYGIACQIFMPYLIIYMKTYLGFGVLEYSIIFGLAITLGAAVNVFLGKLTDRHDKARLMYIAGGIFAVGLLLMYFMRDMSKSALFILFGISGFIMIVGYIFISALAGALTRDFTPAADTGKLQGVRMIFAVLIPMLIGPTVGNAINRAMNIPLPDAGADTMTTSFIPAPEIFLAAAAVAVLVVALVPLLCKIRELQASRVSDGDASAE